MHAVSRPPQVPIVAPSTQLSWITWSEEHQRFAFFTFDYAVGGAARPYEYVPAGRRLRLITIVPGSMNLLEGYNGANVVADGHATWLTSWSLQQPGAQPSVVARYTFSNSSLTWSAPLAYPADGFLISWSTWDNRIFGVVPGPYEIYGGIGVFSSPLSGGVYKTIHTFSYFGPYGTATSFGAAVAGGRFYQTGEYGLNRNGIPGIGVYDIANDAELPFVAWRDGASGERFFSLNG